VNDELVRARFSFIPAGSRPGSCAHPGPAVESDGRGPTDRFESGGLRRDAHVRVAAANHFIVAANPIHAAVEAGRDIEPFNKHGSTEPGRIRGAYHEEA
jgi:hypothetical protein